MDKNTSKSKVWDNKILWAVISVIASVLLWVYVTNTEGDQIQDTFNGVPVVYSGSDAIRDRYGLVITDSSVNTVSVTLRGTRRDISNLSVDNLTAVVDVSRISSAGRNTSNLTISFPSSVNASAITVVSTNPGSVSFYVDRTNSKTIDIKGEFNGTVAEGFAAGDISFNPDTVIISGPENELNQVAYAKVSIDRENVDRTLSYDATYTLVDADGNEVPLGNIVLERETVSVEMKITVSKKVSLAVDLVDGAGASEQNVSVSVEPQTITIAGDAEVLDGINRISIGTVNLASFEQTYENTFPVVLPDGVTNVTGITEAKVTIQVEGLETKRISVTNISVTGQTGELITESVEVLLRGMPEDMAEIQANNIRVVGDTSDLGTAVGEFEVPARIYVDGFTGVGAIGEYTIFIRIT